MVNGQIIYHSKLGNGVPINMPVDSNEIPSDGQWHSLKLQIVQRTLRIYIDNERVGEELDAESVHNFLDPYLTVITLGGFKKEYSSLTELVSKSEFIEHEKFHIISQYSSNLETNVHFSIFRLHR